MKTPMGSTAVAESVATQKRPGLRGSPILFFVCSLTGFLVLAIFLQVLSGAYEVELSGYPDEPAHFVTAVLFREYARIFPHQSFVAFAKEFYIRRPKVALGHWPPVLYILQGAWYCLFGVSRTCALSFMALISAALASSIAVIVRQRCGAVAVAAGALFLCLGVVQTQTSEVMADNLVALFGLWATVAFAKFLKDDSLKSILAFAICALLAVMTKNNGLYLGLAAPLSMLLTKRLGLVRSPRLWLGALIVVLPSAAWIYWSRKVAPNGLVPVTVEYFLRSLRLDIYSYYQLFGAVFLTFAVVGAFKQSAPGERAKDLRPATLASVALGVLVFQSLTGAAIEPRLLAPAVAAIIPLVFFGVFETASWIPAVLPKGVIAGLFLAIGILATPTGTFATPIKKYRGFSSVADFVQSRADLRNAAILVSSSGDGEGLLISESVMRYPWSEGYILRASKLLAESDWLGGHYKPRFSSVTETARYIERLGIRLVVIEQQPATRTPEHQRFLLEVIRANPAIWQEARIADNRARSDPSILVYMRAEENGTPNKAVHSEMEDVLRGILADSL